MAFKVASQKAQAALARILPKYLSNYKETLTLEQKLENLERARTRLIAENSILRAAKNLEQRWEYAQNLEAITALSQESEWVRKDIKKRNFERHELEKAKLQMSRKLRIEQNIKKSQAQNEIMIRVIKTYYPFSQEVWADIKKKTQEEYEKIHG